MFAENFVWVRVLVVCFLYKTNPNPRKGILLWEKVAQMPLFKPNFCCCCCCSHINSWLQCSPRLGLGWHWVGEFVGFMITFYKMWKKTVSCEIEDFVETHVCKLRGILRSRVLRVLCDLIKNASPCWGGQNLTAVQLSECINMWLWICMRPYFNLLDVIWLTGVWGARNDNTLFGESGKLLLVKGNKILVGNGGTYIT